MHLVDLTIEEIIEHCEKHDSNIFCVGAGEAFLTFNKSFANFGVEKFIAGIADNNPSIWGTCYELDGSHAIKIISVADMSKTISQNDIVIITNQYVSELKEQLENLPNENMVAFYGFLIDNYCDTLLDEGHMDADVVREEEHAIPKVIHYCWFGHGKIPDRYREWMRSWKKYCPDYEIVEWNEDNYDVTKNQYMMQAYESKKWGFVPDYARLDIVYKYGGIYLDTDVEVLQPLDALLQQKAFAGFQEFTSVNTGHGFGSEKGNPLIKEMRDDYDNISFIKEDGRQNLTASPFYQTQTLLRHGLKPNGCFQRLKNINIYPKVFFSPMNHYNRVIRKNKNSYLMHHFDGSWVDGKPKDEWANMRGIYDGLRDN